MNYQDFVKECSKIGLSISDAQLNQIKTYLNLLSEKNKVMNLTSITEENEMIEKHAFDSLLAAKDMDFDGKTLIDVGTGGGLPGVILAIVFPSLKVTLLDATKKKIVFLQEVVETLKLKNVSLVNSRIEDFNKRESFDYVISRAFSSLRIFLEVGIPFIKVNGILIAMKGSKGKEELVEATSAMKKLHAVVSNIAYLNLPSGDERVIILVKKESKTEKKYPRKWAEVSSKPL